MPCGYVSPPVNDVIRAVNRRLYILCVRLPVSPFHEERQCEGLNRRNGLAVAALTLFLIHHKPSVESKRFEIYHSIMKSLFLIAALLAGVFACNAQSIPPFDPYKDLDRTMEIIANGSNHESDGKLPIEIFKKKNKFGIKNKATGKELVKPKYDSIAEFKNDYALIVKGNKRGILTIDGKEYLKCSHADIIFPPLYMLEIINNPLFIVSEKPGGKYRIMSGRGALGDWYANIAISPQLEIYGEISDGEWVEINRLTGVASSPSFPATRKEMTIRPLHGKYSLFNNKIYYNGDPDVYKDNNLRHHYFTLFANITAKEISIGGRPFLYSGTTLYDLSPAMNEYRRVNKTNSLVSAGYTATSSPDGFYVRNDQNHSDALYFVKENRMYNAGSKSTRPEYKEVFIIKDVITGFSGLAANEKVIFPAVFENIKTKMLESDSQICLYFLESEKSDYSTSDLDNRFEDLRTSSLTPVALYVYSPRFSRLYGLTDKPMELPKTDDFQVDENILWAHHDDGITAYNLDNGSKSLTGVTDFSKIEEDRYIFSQGGKSGMAIKDNNGLQVTIPAEFNDIRSLKDGIGNCVSSSGPVTGFLVEMDGKKGVFNDDGTERLPCIYDQIEKLYQLYQDVKPLLLEVSVDGSHGVVKLDGTEILPCKYANIHTINDDEPNDELRFKVTDANGNLAILDASGKVMVPFGTYSGFASYGRVYKNDKMGIVDEATYKLIIPCKYDRDAFGDGIMWGAGHGRDRRIAVGYNTPGYATIDVWTLGGKLVASKKFPANARYSMASFLEQWLGIEVGW